MNITNGPAKITANSSNGAISGTNNLTDNLGRNMLRKVAIAIWLITAISAVAQLSYWFGKLPAEVPVHFDAAGDPDGWSSRTSLVVLNVILHLFCLLCLPLAGYASRYLPESLINMPNKEYWLSAEKRNETFRVIDSLLVFTSALTSWLFMIIFHMTALVGIGTRDNILPEFGWAIAVYMGLILAGCGWMMFRFRLPADARLDVETP